MQIVKDVLILILTEPTDLQKCVMKTCWALLELSFVCEVYVLFSSTAYMGRAADLFTNTKINVSEEYDCLIIRPQGMSDYLPLCKVSKHGAQRPRKP